MFVLWVKKTVKLILSPNKLLEQESTPVTKFDEALRLKDQKMHHLMLTWKGIGLSAVQVGWTKQLMVINTMQADKERGRKLTIINPEILDKSGAFVHNEGCLSFPSLYVTNERPDKVLIKYQDVNAEFKETELVGITAFCFLHELDHFHGQLLDKLIKKG